MQTSSSSLWWFWFWKSIFPQTVSVSEEFSPFCKPVLTLLASVDSGTASVDREMSVCHPQLSPMTSRPPNPSRQPAKGISALSAVVTLTLHTGFWRGRRWNQFVPLNMSRRVLTRETLWGQLVMSTCWGEKCGRQSWNNIFHDWDTQHPHGQLNVFFLAFSI